MFPGSSCPSPPLRSRIPPERGRRTDPQTQHASGRSAARATGRRAWICAFEGTNGPAACLIRSGPRARRPLCLKMEPSCYLQGSALPGAVERTPVTGDLDRLGPSTRWRLLQFLGARPRAVAYWLEWKGDGRGKILPGRLSEYSRNSWASSIGIASVPGFSAAAPPPCILVLALVVGYAQCG